MLDDSRARTARMHADPRRRRRRTGPARAGSAAGNQVRLAYLDTVKLLLVAVIIAAHGALAYGSLESAWPYQDIQEVRLGAATDMVLQMVVIPAVLFAMGLFFLISGLLTPGSVSRKGPKAFAIDRVLRLGVPLALWTLIAWPGAIWISHLAAEMPQSFWDQLLVDSDPLLDPGPMWFVEVLLIYSLAYAAWRAWHSRHTGVAARDAHPAAGPSGRTLILLAIAISAATIVIRPLFPITSAQVGQLKLFQWPQFAAMFAFGVIAVQRRWLAPVSPPIRRGCGFAALGGILAFLAIFGISAAVGVDEDVPFETGWHWVSLSLAAVEGPLAVGASIWLLALAQQHLDAPSGRMRAAMSRCAYAAFLLQGVVLIALMVAMRPVDVPAELKALVVAGLGVVGSFALAWLLVNRTRLGRVL